MDNFKHIFKPGRAERPVLLLLHGTGGNETDLVGLAEAVDPLAPLLSLRGNVLENGHPRFFKRLAEGMFDLEDLQLRTKELADFIPVARQHYGITKQPLIALGYSNGANIAANTLLQGHNVLNAAMLLRAMVPQVPETLPDLSATKVLMLSGLLDGIIPTDNAQRLADMFRTAQAEIDLRLKPVTHSLGQSDIMDMRDWLSTHYP